MTDAAEIHLTRVPDIGSAAIGSAAEMRLSEHWESAPGWRGWLSTVDHKVIGIRYLVTAFIFLLMGGVEALIMRVQLASPEQSLLTPEQYNQLFTMHGITMIFLYSLPILSGFSNYLWPLMLGSRDMAFPRLNSLSYWLFLFAGIFLYASFPLGQAPNAGWFNYVPFAGPEYNTGPNIDVYALGMVLLGISTTVGAINFIVTLFRMRAPGMSIGRVPILVWGTLTAAVANVFAVPSVSLAFFLLWLDRQAGTHFFDVLNGGKPLLWQHLFWMFGHPWVYAVVLPAMGIVSDALPTFCRRPLVGYSAVALSTMATMLLGFGVWIHHMFATGLPTLALSFFGATSMVISIPSGVAVFAWIATIWLGRPVFTTAFLFFAGFVILFVIGGFSGVMVAAVPLDLQLNETYFVVAHLHYVLLGINVFPVVGGIYYWFPKFFGRLMNETLGKWSFWVMFIGFNAGFFPMHVAGLLGMPRRIYTYAPHMGWGTVNMVTSVGSFIFATGILLFTVNILVSLKRGAVATANPWDAPTLEWAVPSPPPAYNFAVIPFIVSRHPLWEDRLNIASEMNKETSFPRSGVGMPKYRSGGTEHRSVPHCIPIYAPEGTPERGNDSESMHRSINSGLYKDTSRSSLDQGYLLTEGRETIGTTPLDALPDIILKMPEDSYAPFFLGLFSALVFVGLLVHSRDFTVLMVVACSVSLMAWLWPSKSLVQRVPEAEYDKGVAHG